MSGSRNRNHEIAEQDGWDLDFDGLGRSPSIFDTLVSTILDLSTNEVLEPTPVIDNVPRTRSPVPAQTAFDSRNAPLTGDSFIPNWDAIPDDEDFRL